MEEVREKMIAARKDAVEEFSAESYAFRVPCSLIVT
jgi:hypothetical protein